MTSGVLKGMQQVTIMPYLGMCLGGLRSQSECGCCKVRRKSVKSFDGRFAVVTVA